MHEAHFITDEQVHVTIIVQVSNGWKSALNVVEGEVHGVPGFPLETRGGTCTCIFKERDCTGSIDRPLVAFFISDNQIQIAISV